MKIVHTADNHLDMPLTYLSYEKAAIRKKERLLSFSEIIDFTINNQADMLLISGDLFHSSSPSPGVVSFCAQQFERLGSIPVFIALGNHDCLASAYNFPGNVHIFSDTLTQFSLPEAVVHGISFSSPNASLSSRLTPVTDNSKINILCIHGDIFSQSSDYNPLNKDFLSLLGFDYTALGHIHESHIFPKMAYPGCHDGGGFDESGTKGFLFCEIEKGMLPSIKFIPSSSRIYEEITLDISGFSSSESISRELEGLISDGIYKIILTGHATDGFSPSTEHIRSCLEKKAFFVKVESQVKENSPPLSGPLWNLTLEYLKDNCTAETALLAEKYAALALKGDDFF